MRALLLALPVAFATPAVAQMHDMHMPGMTMPAAKPPAKAASGKRQARTERPQRPAPPTPTRTGGTPARTGGTPARTGGTPTRTEPAMPMQAMPGMTMPPAGACPPEHAAMGHCQSIAPPTSTPTPLPTPCPPEHAAMGHCQPAAATPAAGRSGTDQAAGDGPAPAPPATRAADAFYPAAAMATADRAMRAEHGGMTFSQIILNIAELQVRQGRDGYRWDGEGWFGGDIHRLVVKSEGEGALRDRLETAEVQALYARTLDPYWNLQAGIRQDLGAGAKRTYATLGVEGLAPYWFDVEGALFLSDKGDVLARGEAWYDQRITQRAILQPRVEVNLAAQDMPASRIGAGLSSAEIGLRLRYEIAREFAPYVGLSWERRYGATGRYARAQGDDTGGFALALGLRTWF